MQATYAAFTKRMIQRYEGGYVWKKSDPGGPTKYGVTWRVLAAFRTLPATSAAEWAPLVKAMDIGEAVEIYRKKYAPAIRYDDLPAGVDACNMDYGVNTGPGRSNRVARKIVGAPDGTTMTPEVVALIKAYPANIFINKMCDERLAFMKSLKGGKMWEEYGDGWAARVKDLRAYCLALAIGTTVPELHEAPDLSNVPTPKAEIEKPGNTTPTVSTSVTGALTGAAAYFTDLPWLYIGLGVGAVVLVGFIYVVVRDTRAALEEQKVHI